MPRPQTEPIAAIDDDEADSEDAAVPVPLDKRLIVPAPPAPARFLNDARPVGAPSAESVDGLDGGVEDVDADEAESVSARSESSAAADAEGEGAASPWVVDEWVRVGGKDECGV